ncbi:hypothetical protein BD311DRAFT_745810 [Dichomitus squalens]|uniref:Hydrophobic surface binding protein A-domain-containing protein n=1 Tax=Dichomitus squalens TaxID=114155 RepID=A0A4Q9N5D1_9APHY|nr:hypothetical protein BD311DRAFT_745810 [Dichomitus squalens]
MPVLSRVIFFGFQAALLVSIGGPVSAPLSALATPLPFPMPLMPHVADYASRIPVRNYTTVVQDPLEKESSVARRDMDPVIVDHASSFISSYARRQDDSLTALTASAAELDGLASQASTSGDDPVYQAQVLSAVTGYQTDLLGFRTLLGDQEKGLANYDPNDPLEDALKAMINATKDALSSITTIVYGLPVLGPILGPVVYEIKCLLDQILDLTENLTDGLLNLLIPDLNVVIALATAIMVVPA